MKLKECGVFKSNCSVVEKSTQTIQCQHWIVSIGAIAAERQHAPRPRPQHLRGYYAIWKTTWYQRRDVARRAVAR